MKLESLISRVRNSAGDRDAMQFTDDQLLEWVNDGIRECAVQNNLLQKRATNVASSGQSEYTLPPDILKLYSIKFDGTKLQGYTLDEFDEKYGNTDGGNNSTPNCFYVWGGVLTLWPAPSSDGVLSVEYIYHPTELTSSDYENELPLPVGYHSRIVDYCLAQVAQQDDDINRYTAKMQEFNTGVSQLKDQPEYTEDQYPSINISSRDMGSGAFWEDM